MKCPFCDREMEKGYITSDGNAIAWRKERHESALVGKGGGVQLSWNILGGAAAVKNAYHCKGCEKIVIDYSDIQ
ncbi:PF20097 family protein [Harryflintia acetispora]|uniref:DUF6487 domain-containing protein n=1 Tax=Harryflintia acetispora TaxID=1849041 RepID=A0A9X8Y7F4_9FIRM|nr:PF20097 family protein [Harryflintia acetispora]TCL41906.1 hypothetical protein EDD78_11276 [Harryflintia acetispora]